MDYLQFIAAIFPWLVFLILMLVFRTPIERLMWGLRPKSFKGFGVDAQFETVLDKVEELVPPKPPSTPPQPVLTGAPAPQLPSPVPPSVTVTTLSRPASHGSVVTPWSTTLNSPSLQIHPDIQLHTGTYIPLDVLPTTAPAVRVDSPEANVLFKFGELENVLRWVQSDGEDEASNGWVGARKNVDIDALARKLGLPEPERQALRELRKLRNQVAHGDSTDLSYDESLRFSNAVDSIMERISERQRLYAIQHEGLTPDGGRE